MKIKVTTDFRKFKAGEEIEFKLPITVIVGENGCGKSSLIHAIRGKFDTKPSDTGSFFKSDYIELAKNIEVETEIKKFIFFDSVKDDGGHMNNSYDALAFLENGGFHTKSLSHGETQLFYINRLLSEILKFREVSDEKIMIVLDEFDKGFSLTNQSKVINILHNISSMYNCQIICISHNYLLIDKMIVVYDLEARDFAIAQEYLSKFK